MKYELTGVFEDEIIVRQPFEPDSDEQVTINWAFEIEPQFLDETTLRLRFTAVVHSVPENEIPNLLKVRISHLFTFAEKPDFYPFLPTTTMNEEQRMQAATLIGIAAGTVRGIAYARTAGTLGHSLFMPVIHPLGLLDHYRSH